MFEGSLRKMHSEVDQEGNIHYRLKDKSQNLYLNPLIGKKLSVRFEGGINCIACHREIKKSFQQGYCFPCVRSLPETDLCQVRPELCHYSKGTCRNEEWGQKHCMIPHTVYLALSSDIKVGITRSHTRLTRWVDQGAVSAVPVAGVKSRAEAGKAEVALKKIFADQTNWRSMLKGLVVEKDLKKERLRALGSLPPDLDIVPDALKTPLEFHYPVAEAPATIKSINLDKTPFVEETLRGIKGQYLIFDSGVLNIRKFSGYFVRISLQENR